jgi:hypothetical protein
MAAQTFRDVWGVVALHCPLAPVGLVKNWVQTSYDDLNGRRHWAWLRTNSQLTTLAARALTITYIQGSTAITSVGGFVASDVGRQIRVGGTAPQSNSPIYTINTVTNPNAADLTIPYASTGGAFTSTIRDIYLVMPADFRSFLTVTDQTIQRPIAWWISKDRLDLFDPGRIAGDTRFRVLAANGLSDVTSLAGRITYEAWPFPSAAGTYTMWYFKRTDTLTDDFNFTGALATWTTALQKGALAEAAAWPGTPTQKNPYFNLPLATRLRGEFDESTKGLDVMDDDTYLMDLAQVDLSKYGLAALSADTTLMRQSDATLADYY